FLPNKFKIIVESHGRTPMNIGCYLVLKFIHIIPDIVLIRKYPHSIQIGDSSHIQGVNSISSGFIYQAKAISVCTVTFYHSITMVTGMSQTGFVDAANLFLSTLNLTGNGIYINFGM